MRIYEHFFVREIINAERLTIRDAHRRALRYSSGRFKANRLAKMGHPYSARRGAMIFSALKVAPSGKILSRAPVPYGDPAKINVQSGDFFLAWQHSNPQFTGDEIKTELTNKIRYAQYLASGTDRMIRRPLMERLVHPTNVKRIINLTKGIRNAIRQNRIS